MRWLVLLLGLAATSCSTEVGTEAERARMTPVDLPAMKVFSTPRAARPARSNAEIAQDFMDLTFRLESGRRIETFTRFEGPITVRLAGEAPRSL